MDFFLGVQLHFTINQQLFYVRPVNPDWKEALAVIDTVGDQAIDFNNVVAELRAGFLDEVDSIL